MAALWDVLPAPVKGGYAKTAAELVPQLEGAFEAGDVVVVKGSKGSRASLIVEALAGRESR